MEHKEAKMALRSEVKHAVIFNHVQNNYFFVSNVFESKTGYPTPIDALNALLRYQHGLEFPVMENKGVGNETLAEHYADCVVLCPAHFEEELVWRVFKQGDNESVNYTHEEFQDLLSCAA